MNIFAGENLAQVLCGSEEISEKRREKHGKSDMDCSMDYFCLNPFDIMVPVRT